MQDTPKNLGLAITCPISMDMETGPFLHNRNMEQGYFCRPLAEFPAEVAVHLRPSSFQVGTCCVCSQRFACVRVLGMNVVLAQLIALCNWPSHYMPDCRLFLLSLPLLQCSLCATLAEQIWSQQATRCSQHGQRRWPHKKSAPRYARTPQKCAKWSTRRWLWWTIGRMRCAQCRPSATHRQVRCFFFYFFWFSGH